MHNQYQPEAARTCGPMHNERRRMLVDLYEAPQLQGIQLLVVRVNRVHSNFYELRERGVINWLACAHCEVFLVPLRHNLCALGTPAVDDERAEFLSGFVLLLDLLLRLIRLCCTGYAGCQMSANRSWLPTVPCMHLPWRRLDLRTGPLCWFSGRSAGGARFFGAGAAAFRAVAATAIPSCSRRALFLAITTSLASS